MRGTRAKKLRKLSLLNPATFADTWHGQTFVRGGSARTYKRLKNDWKKKGL